jgi:AcrR family transcriptional regulator
MKRDLPTEERILKAARKVFLDKGLEGSRMQDIADTAGINKAMLHYYFRSKEKLFETIFSEVVDGFLPRIFGILNADDSLFEKINKFCSAYIEQELETPYVPFFIVGEMNRDPKAFLKKVLKGKKPPLRKVTLQIQEEIKKGSIKKFQPVELLLTVLSLCVFPFLARPMLQTVTGMNMKQFITLMEKRKIELPGIIIKSIKA